MNEATRAVREQWIKEGRCFSCGSPRNNPWSPSDYYCLRHFIRRGLAKRNLFFSKTVQHLPKNSRVRLERLSRRRFILNHLRSRFISVRERRALPFSTIRETLFFIDDMWSALHLHHSFVLRTVRLARLVRYLMLLDGYASGSLIPRRGWRGSLTNRRTGPARRNQCAPTGNLSSPTSTPTDSSTASADTT